MSSREVIEPHQGDIRYARRDSRHKAKTIVPKGQGDCGDEEKS
jgi:hypothetical protein